MVKALLRNLRPQDSGINACRPTSLPTPDVLTRAILPCSELRAAQPLPHPRMRPPKLAQQSRSLACCALQSASSFSTAALPRCARWRQRGLLTYQT